VAEQLVPIRTPKGVFKVWTKRVGDNPTHKLLLLHGGPAATHEYWLACDGHLPQAGIEYIYYDQLGSAFSDQPGDDDLWTIERFVDEVDQVRRALGLTRDNFFLAGHSWGGILAIEYALKHQDHLKGLVISNMMASVPAYNDYANRVLKPQMDQSKLKEIEELEAKKDFENPRFMALLMEQHYEHHILRRPAAEWPDEVNRSFARLNYHVYTLMQGPSELGASGRLEHWDRVNDLPSINVPTLVIGATHDSMDPKHMEMMASKIPNARFHLCAKGSHLCMWDDQQSYFEALVKFVLSVN
jgi:proline iminopeptidase